MKPKHQTLALPKQLRKKLKKPFGKLAKTTQQIKAKKIIAVGDKTAFMLIKNKKNPIIIIYDCMEQRMPVHDNVKKTMNIFKAGKIRIKNPAGTIQKQAWNAIAKALESKRPTKIEVKGEEDLLVLPAIMLAKNSTIVCYGQPNRGIVTITVNKKTKQKVREILEKMEVMQ